MCIRDRFGSDAAFAALGIGLLIADVLLPVPSTLVAMALCWRLGPWWGGASVAAGFSLSFVVGYALGRSAVSYTHLDVYKRQLDYSTPGTTEQGKPGIRAKNQHSLQTHQRTTGSTASV